MRLWLKILVSIATCSGLYAQGSLSTNARRLQGKAISSTAPSNGQCLAWVSATSAWTPASCTAGTAAPVNATYITQTANAILTNEQALGSLATGILKSTTTTGVVSIAAGTDIPAPGADTRVILNSSGFLGSNASLTYNGSLNSPAFTGTPGSDVPTATFRRFGSGQASNILQLQTEANAALAGFAADGHVGIGVAPDTSSILISGATVSATSVGVSAESTASDSAYAGAFQITASPSANGASFVSVAGNVVVPDGDTHTYHELTGGDWFVSFFGQGTADFIYGEQSEVDLCCGSGAGTSGSVWGYYATIYADSAAVVTNGVTGFQTKLVTGGSGSITTPNYWGYYMSAPTAGEVTITNAYSHYTEDLAGVAANTYYDWDDSRGVRRVKEDSAFDSVGQAIEALYNPQFTKYTPGATNLERVVLGQWNGNVAEIGTEKGGTGTLRNVRLIGAALLVDGLKTTGAAGSKKVVCVDTATGQLYASSTGVDCSN